MISFATQKDFLDTPDPIDGDYVYIQGMHSPGDGGGHYKYRCDTPNDPSPWKVEKDGWWELRETNPNPIMFGAKRVSGEAGDLYDSGPYFLDFLDYVATCSGSGEILTGAYLSSKSLRPATGTAIEGRGTNEKWEIPFYDPASMTLHRGVTIGMLGDGDRDLTLDRCSSMRHSGAYRVNPRRLFNNVHDQYFEATDFTNGDAVGATQASLRAFSAAVVLGSDGLSGKTIWRNIRVVPVCDDGVNGPFAGYLAVNANNYVPWAEWDFGILNLNPYGALIEDCQFVGYWHRKGYLQTSIRYGNTQIGGRGEMALGHRNYIQGGEAIRNPDFAFALSKTASSVTIAWWNGHRLTPSGKVYADSVELNYTSLSYSSAGEGNLTLQGIADTSAIVTSGDDRTMIHLGNNNGTTQSALRDSDIRDFWHPSSVERPSSFYGVQAGKYSAIFEYVGYPVRGLLKENNTAYGKEPFFLIMMGSRDNYWEFGTTEGRSYRAVGNGPLNPHGAQQMVAVVGPDAAHASTWNMLARGSITLQGYPWTGKMNLSPIVPSSSGLRYSSYSDWFHPFYFKSEDGVYDARLPEKYVINNGTVTLYNDVCAIDTESGFVDDLDTINAPLWLNRVTIYSYSSSRITTVKSLTGNINTYGVNVPLLGGKSLTLFRRNGIWYRDNNA